MFATPRQHLDNYVEFSRLERWTSGPGPHRKVAEVLARESQDPAWAIGLYGMAYTTAGMEVLLDAFPTRDDYRGLFSEVENLATRVPHREERRVNGFGSRRLDDMLCSYRNWLLDEGLERAQSAASFDEAFRLVGGRLTHFGRFFGVKLYEALERTVGLPHFDDIRPRRGHWARRTLQLFYPGHDPNDDSQVGLEEAIYLSEVVKATAAEMGVILTHFEVESMLCNYRQMVNGKKYAGGDTDGDLGYVTYGQKLNHGMTFRTLEIRDGLVPAWGRGELQGWKGRRQSLDGLMARHGVMWSDARYSWHESVHDLSAPVRWVHSKELG